ncbi:MAG: MATE family efflux transporter, partial [Pseudomonadota bacterium]
GVGVLVGINSVVSRALGGGEVDLAKRRAAQGVAIALMFGLTVGGALFGLERALFQLLGASDALAVEISKYMRPYALGFPLLLLSMGANGTLRAQGAAKRSASILLSMAAANWVLDPLLIAGWGPLPSYGIAGAAYASVGAFAIAAAVAITLAARSRLGLPVRRLPGSDWSKGIAALADVGAPAALSNSINPVGLTILTGFLASFGEDAVAAFGVAGRVQSFAVVPLLAMSSSIGGIVGQNWGAGLADRSRLALKEASAFSVGYGLVIAALLVVFCHEAAAVFSDDTGVQDEIALYLRIAAWGICAYGVLIVTNGALNAIGRAKVATAISALRVLAVMIPAAWIGRELFQETGVFAAELVANLVGGAIAYGIGVRSLRAENCPAAVVSTASVTARA